MKKVVKVLAAFVGKLGNDSEMCLGFFYSPKKPAALK